MREQRRHLEQGRHLEQEGASADAKWDAEPKEQQRAAVDRRGLLAGTATAAGHPYLARKGIPTPDATATSRADMMKFIPVVAAFDARNLLHVAEEWKRRHPQIGVIVAGNNDHRREAEDKPNAGKQAAMAATEAVGGVAMLRSFEPDDGGSDWNDVCKARGIDKACVQFRRALDLAERER
jgi:hypothetical protein